MAAVFSGDLVDAPCQAAADAEVVGVEGQDLSRLDGPPEPLGKGDFAVLEAAFGVVFSLQGGGFEDAENVGLFNVAGADVGLDGAATEAENGLFKAFVVFSGDALVGEAEQVGRVNEDAAGDGVSAVLGVRSGCIRGRCGCGATLPWCCG